jgi:phosphoribosylformylglycinamidine (FGAM) synthase-like enzyme
MEATVMTTSSSAVVPSPVTVTPQVLATHSITAEEYSRILDALGRVPSLTELGIFSVMWSEHCSYKSSRVHLRRLPTESERVALSMLAMDGPAPSKSSPTTTPATSSRFKARPRGWAAFCATFSPWVLVRWL